MNDDVGSEVVRKRERLSEIGGNPLPGSCGTTRQAGGFPAIGDGSRAQRSADKPRTAGDENFHGRRRGARVWAGGASSLLMASTAATAMSGSFSKIGSRLVNSRAENEPAIFFSAVL